MACNIIDKSFGTQVTSVSTSGDLLSIPSANQSDNYTTITVFNDSNGAIRFDYMAQDGGIGIFIVPTLKIFTRKLYNTSFVHGSIKLTSLSGSTTTGVITINLGV